MNTEKIFADLKKIVDEDKANGVIIDRHHPAQRIINKFSGEYSSPTMIKGFFDCSANQLFSSFQPFIASEATAVGQSVHLIFQKFYDLESDRRDINILDSIMEDVIKEKGQEKQLKQIKQYVDGFKVTRDYIGEDQEMDHKGLVCFNELFMKGSCSPLGVKLPLPTYCLADRIDFREDGVHIIDYKTGTYLNKKITTMDGYLPQMINYLWMVEQEYGEKVVAAHLLIPGTKQKIVNLDVLSLENQSRYVEKIFKFTEDFRTSAKTRQYEEKKMTYCNYCKMKDSCNVFNGTNNKVKIPIEYDTTIKEK